MGNLLIISEAEVECQLRFRQDSKLGPFFLFGLFPLWKTQVNLVLSARGLEDATLIVLKVAYFFNFKIL